MTITIQKYNCQTDCRVFMSHYCVVIVLLIPDKKILKGVIKWS